MTVNYINEVAIKMLNSITSQSQSSVATMFKKKGKSSKEKTKKPEEQLDFTKRILSLKNHTVMVAGQPRNGKSTALNNLLGLKLPTGCGAKSVTQTATVESATSQEGVRVCGIDTPGLQATDDVNTEKVWEGMVEKIGQGVDNFTLLYCMSVFNADNADALEIMKGLTERFGDDIWKRCVLVLTFCDTARSENYKAKYQDEAYKAYLRACVEVFKEALRECTSDTIPVKLILDCRAASPDKNGMTVVEATPDTIVAVPVAKSRELGRNPNILPGFNIGGNRDWTDYAFFEMVRKSGKFSMPEKSKLHNALGRAAGTAVGAGIGAVVAGPVGAVIGGGIGSIVGGVMDQKN